MKMNSDHNIMSFIETVKSIGLTSKQMALQFQNFLKLINNEEINKNYNSNYETIVKNQVVIKSISSLDKKRVKNILKKYDKNIKNYFL